MDNVEVYAEQDELLMVDISGKYKQICELWYRRKVFMSESVHMMLCCAITDGFVYARTRKTKFEPYVRHGALYHLLQCSRERIVKQLGNHKAIFRTMLRWDGSHYLFTLAIARNKQQVMIININELEYINQMGG